MPIVNTDLKVPTMGITDLGYNIVGNDIVVQVKVQQYTQTYLRANVNFNRNSYMTNMYLSYLAVDNSFAPPLSMNYFFPVLP